MNKVQENKLSMYLLVEKTCNENQAVWKTVKAFANAKDQLSELIIKIKRERQFQEKKYTGITKQRNELKKELIDTSIEFVSILKDFALINNFPILNDEISYSKNDLLRSRDTILEDKCTLIYKKAKTHLNKLSDYGITADSIQEFKTLIHSYSEQFSDSKEAIIKHKEATGKIEELFKQGDIIVYSRLDGLIKLFRKRNTDFFISYANARKAIRIHAKKKYEQPALSTQQAA